MRLKIEISLNNAEAMDYFGEECDEVSEHRAALYLQACCTVTSSGAIMDGNGNKIGTAKIVR